MLMLFAMLKTVLEVVRGGVEDRYMQQRAGEVPDFMCSQMLAREVLQLGKERKRVTQQYEATKDDDAVIP
jgi:hypothetical protein